MYRAYNKIKMLQDVFVIVEVSMGQNIAFNAFEYTKILFTRIDGVDDLPLTTKVINLKSSRVICALTVI